MRYNPRFSAVITTPLTPELVSLTLQKHTVEKEPGFFSSFSGIGGFFGQVGTDEFDISPVVINRQFSIEIHGTVTPSDRGSTVFLDMQLDSSVKSFSLVWLMFCLFFLLLDLVFQVKDFIAWFAPFGLFAFARLVTHLGFSYWAKESHQRLRKLLLALPET